MKAVIERALQHDLFAHLDEPTRADLGSAFEVIELRPGEVLFREGESGDSMYVCHSGDLVVESSGAAVASVGPGEVVGEIALIVSEARNATVTAASPTLVAKLSGTEFLAAAERHPEMLERFALSVAERIRERNLALVVSELPGIESPEDVQHVVDAVTWRHIASGGTLFVQGEPSDSVALIVSGAFDVSVIEDGETHRIGRISRGEFAGEMALVNEAPRSATVTAVRDSEVALLTTDGFERITRRFPDLALALVRNTASRLVDANRLVRPLRHDAHTTAFVPIDLEATRWLAEGVVDDLTGSAVWLDRQRFESAFGRTGIADTSPDDPANVALVGWLSRFEHEHDYVAYIADPTDTNWTQRCLRQADRVYVVARAASNPEPSDLERRITGHIPAGRVQLVLVHEQGVDRPTGTEKWLEPRRVARHHHIRRGESQSLARIARRISGETVGVVFGGGGARGFVHGGVARALAETGTPVDLMGGTSMGALVSAKALLDGWEAFYDVAARFGRRREIIDYTLPVSALSSSRRVTQLLERLYGDARIEDLWLPWFAVSTNLSKARPEVMTSGLLRNAVRASISIPGVFSPVARNGDLIVDGGVMNNLPVDLARTLGGAGHVIAVNASPRRERTRPYEFSDHVSGWRQLWAKIIPGVTAERVPPLGMTMMRALDVNSSQRTMELRPSADLMIAPDTSGFGVLQWEAHAQLLETGYRSALEILTSESLGLEGSESTQRAASWEPGRDLR